MIIKRQKLYTRQDQKVIREIVKATNGLRSLPKGVKGLTTRDALRLEKLNQEIGKGKITDVEGFQTLATHLDLPETAKGGKHLVEKYNNPELLKRYRSIKAQRLGVEEEYKRLEELNKERRELRKKAADSRKRLEEKRELRGTAGKKSKYRTKDEKNLRQWSKETREERDNLVNIIDSKTTEPKRISDRNKDKRRELYIKSNEAAVAENMRELGKEEQELKERLKKGAGRSGIRVKGLEDKNRSSHIGMEKVDSNGNPRKRGVRVMELEENATPWTVAHEHGHAKFSRRVNKGHKSSQESSWRREGPLFFLSNEHGANVEGAQLVKNDLRKQGKSEGEIKEALDKYWNNREKSYMTYYQSERSGPFGIYNQYQKKTQLLPGRMRRSKKK